MAAGRLPIFFCAFRERKWYEVWKEEVGNGDVPYIRMISDAFAQVVFCRRHCSISFGYFG